MKTLVIYDSLFGNTEKIAKAISGAIPSSELKLFKEVEIEKLKSPELLIVGSPTQGGRPTEELMKFLKRIPQGYLKGVNVTAFDTRFAEEKQKLGLKLLMKTIGYAAPKIAKTLTDKGGKLIDSPQGFIVIKKEGPLLDKEIENAASWAKSLN